MTEIFCVQNILFLKPQQIHFDKNTCIINWIVIASFWKMPRIFLCTLFAATSKIIITMLLQTTPSDLMKYLLVSCYFEFHLLSFHSGSQVVPRKKLIIVTRWYWTSHTITVNLFLCFVTHFSLSFSFLTYKTFLTCVNAWKHPSSLIPCSKNHPTIVLERPLHLNWWLRFLFI